jgi:hypothetical protein
LLTDPPYNISEDGAQPVWIDKETGKNKTTIHNQKFSESFEQDWDDVGHDEFLQQINSWANVWFKKIRKGGSFAIFIVDGAGGVDTPSALAVFPVSIESEVAGEDAPLVAPSVFNAPVSEGAAAFDSILANAVFAAILTDSAVAVDELVRRLLWEVINDAQAVNWNDANTSQSTAWGTINSSQPTAWTPVKTQT